MTTPDNAQQPLSDTISDYINGLPQIDAIAAGPRPTPSRDPSGHLNALVVLPSALPSGAALTDQPAQAAYGACLFSEDDIETATQAAREWQFQLTAESGADIAAVLTRLVPKADEPHLTPCWALIWFLPQYPSSDAQQMQTAIERWTSGPAQACRGTKQFCALGAVQLLVNTGYTESQARQHLATVLQKFMDNRLGHSGPFISIDQGPTRHPLLSTPPKDA